MKRLIQLVVLLAIPLLSAGCFRSAGDTIEPTQDAASNSVVLESTTTTPSSGLPGTPTLPPITILAPNTRPAVTDEVPVEAATTRSPQTIVPPPTATPQFITPGSPLGPVPIETSTPRPASEITAEAESAGDTGDGEGETTRINNDPCIYIVESGDSLYSIAIDHDTTIDDLLAANPDLDGDPPVIFPEDELNLPDCDGTTTRTPRPTATAEPTNAPGTATAGEVYTVEPGDTLFNIATRYGVTIADIVDANPGLDPDRLSIGQRIVIPPDEE